MKDYTVLFNELYAIDIAGLPFNDEDYDDAIRFNLHRQYADNNKMFVLIGTKGGIEGFIVNYRINHPRCKRKIGEPFSIGSFLLHSFLSNMEV